MEHVNTATWTRQDLIDALALSEQGNAALGSELDAVREKLATLAANVEKLRRHHLDIGEDCWFNCPKSGECCNDGAGDECDCGADEHNKLVDEIILAATKKE